MGTAIAKESINQLFTEARTHHAWLEKPVEDELLQAIFDLAKWGPTSVNSSPVRILFVKSKAAKEKLLPALAGSNPDQVRAAPVTAIIAYDEKFYEELPALFPAFDARSLFVSNPSLSEQTAFRNSSLQGAYFMLAARSLGLDVGPMSGFDNAKVDEAFFKGTSWKSNFLCNVGYGDASKLYPRGPRLDFSQSSKIV
ncbi:MAG: malonic semialdehyde reductase [Nitrosomonadales bacterium]